MEEATREKVGPQMRVVMWRCEGCGEELKESDLFNYGSDKAHRITLYDRGPEISIPIPHPCGPVMPTILAT